MILQYFKKKENKEQIIATKQYKQIIYESNIFLNENKYDYATYPKDDSKIANEIRLLQEQQFRRNSTDIFESLMTYAFNQTPTMPKKEIPEAFRESTSVFSGTNPIR